MSIPRFSFEADSDRRFRFMTDPAEMDRRWDVTRKAMAREEVDCIVMWGCDRMFSGALKYLTDLQVAVYPHAAMFSQEGMTILGHGEFGGRAYGDYISSRNIINNISVPFLPSMPYTNDYCAEELRKIIAKAGYKRVGFISMNIIPASLFVYLKEHLPGVEFVDSSRMMDGIRAVKSEYELELCAKAVALHDDIMAAVPTLIRVGRTERELCCEIRKIADDMFCTDFVVLAGAHPVLPGGNLYLYANNTIKRGDYVYLLIELAGPGGVWAELGRTFCMDEPSKEMLKAWDDAVKLENSLAAMCRPGVAASKIFTECNSWLTGHGYVPELKFFAHGQGYEIVERPVICEEEDMVFEENMYISMHPRCKNDHAAAICMDNFVITKQGGKLLNSTPQELVCINY
jgi:Xaa-Pro aminopeptidase